jgi:hydroxymethylglutaryl-CoA lyase
LAIIANTRGASDACNFQKIDYLGFPLSVSEEFQKRNTNKSIEQALKTVEEIQNLLINHNKELVVYLSMSFGNPYAENYHPDIVAKLTEKLDNIEVGIVALSDTVGISNSENITPLFRTLIKEFPTIEFGAHFHTTENSWRGKIEAAYQNGCRRFDAALKGYGGCPMAKDDLVGNMPTEKLITYFTEKLGLNLDELEKSLILSSATF